MTGFTEIEFKSRKSRSTFTKSMSWCKDIHDQDLDSADLE